MQERRRSWSVVRAWTSCRIQASSHVLSAKAASTGCTRNAVGSSTWQRTLITDVHSAMELHAPWMADYKGKSKSDLLLPRRYALSTAAGGFELPTTACVKTAWKKFKELLPILSSCHLSRHVYSSCVRSAMLHASETWPLTKPNPSTSAADDRAMIRQICNVKPQDIVATRSNELLAQLGMRIWTSFWKREGSAGMDMWNALMVQSRQPLTWKHAKATHIFSAKNIRILCIESAKTDNNMTLKELVKQRRFEQLGLLIYTCSHQITIF